MCPCFEKGGRRAEEGLALGNLQLKVARGAPSSSGACSDENRCTYGHSEVEYIKGK